MELQGPRRTRGTKRPLSVIEQGPVPGSSGRSSQPRADYGGHSAMTASPTYPCTAWAYKQRQVGQSRLSLVTGIVKSGQVVPTGLDRPELKIPSRISEESALEGV